MQTEEDQCVYQPGSRNNHVPVLACPAAPEFSDHDAHSIEDAGKFDLELVEAIEVIKHLESKMALASHIVECALNDPVSLHDTYRPLQLAHYPPDQWQHHFEISGYQAKLWVFSEASDYSDALLFNSEAAVASLRATALSKPLSWLVAKAHPPPPMFPCPPSYVQRFIMVCLSGVNVWLHSPALCSTVSLPLDPVWENLQLVPEGARHFLAVLPDIHDSRVPMPEQGFLWLLSPDDPEYMPLLAQSVTRLASAEFQGKCWILYGSPEAVSNLSDVQRCRLHCFFKVRRRGASHLWSREPESDATLRLYTEGAQRALATTNLESCHPGLEHTRN